MAEVKNPADGLQARVAAQPFWFHSIDLGHGVVTKGIKSPETLRAETEALQLPDLKGRSVLDIGAWDGYYTFEAERRGARRVVSLDHFVWQIDRAGTGGEWPGRRPYELAHATLGSRAEPVAADYMTVDWQSIGAPFDVVFYMDVLYHMEDPLAALKRVRQATAGVAVIETAAVDLPYVGDHALCEFYETTELNGDPTNWWAPNEKALVGMCRAAGFTRVEVKSIAPSRTWPEKTPAQKVREAAGRLLRSAGLRREVEPPPQVIHYRAIVHAHA